MECSFREDWAILFLRPKRSNDTFPSTLKVIISFNTGYKTVITLIALFILRRTRSECLLNCSLPYILLYSVIVFP